MGAELMMSIFSFNFKRPKSLKAPNFRRPKGFKVRAQIKTNGKTTLYFKRAIENYFHIKDLKNGTNVFPFLKYFLMTNLGPLKICSGCFKNVFLLLQSILCYLL